jgi:hypothetical protein
MRSRGWTAVTVLGALVAVGAPAGWALTRPAQDVGTAAAEALASAAPAGPDSAEPAGTGPAGEPGSGGTAGAPAPVRSAAGPGPGRSGPGSSGGSTPGGSAGRSGLGGTVGGVGSGSAVPVEDGRLRGGRAGRAALPDRLELPTLGVRAPVRPVGVDGGGQLAIPGDVAVVGWYRYGPRPSDPAGSTVLSGHVDSAEQGRGAFFRLRALGPGDPVLVHDTAGRTRRYRVVAREEWPKSEVPLARIFSRGGAPRLTLVTCGGGFREDVRSYRDNIAVTAVPDGPP